MAKLITKVLILELCLLLSGQLQAQNSSEYPERLRRSESFFGLHFDFHARATDQNVGETLTEGMIDSMLLAVQPDFIQVDCKGHPGITSYPTKTEIGTSVASFAQDPLMLIREVTARRGVGLYVHYSGVIDRQVVSTHPQWASLDTAGQPNSRGGLSVYSPYVDELLIPQLKELSSKYNIDGAWVDGECWGLQPDYNPLLTKSFLAESGLSEVPHSPADPHYPTFLEFNRQGFLKYLAHYVDAIHAYDPDFQVTSNWAYSSFMPEAVNTNVDYLSGDLTPSNAVYRAAFEARCLAPQGKPWDIMAWSFAWGRELGNSTKTALQLQQEAAQVLAMGGGFQVYFKQNRDASIQPWTVPIMQEVAEFCRTRQEYTHRAQPVPQIALLYSNAGYKAKTHNIYSPWNDELVPTQGILYALLDGQHCIEVLREHHLQGSMDQYPLIVIPEWEYLEPPFIKELEQYVLDGGKLLVIGAKAVDNFQDILKVNLADTVVDQVRQLGYQNHLAGLRTHYRPVTLQGSAQAFGTLYTLMDDRFEDESAIATVADYGQGKIAGVYADLGEVYLNRKTPVYRDFLSGLVEELFTEPMVSVEGSQQVHVAANRLNNQLLINLVNTSGEHANENVYVLDEIPPIGPLTVSIRTSQRPAKMTLQPENRPLNFIYEDGSCRVIIPELKIHSIIAIE
jgi:hypothetical protein